MQRTWGRYTKQMLISSIVGAWLGATFFPDFVSVLKGLFTIANDNLPTHLFLYAFTKDSFRILELLDMNLVELFVLFAVFLSVIFWAIVNAIQAIVQHQMPPDIFGSKQEQELKHLKGQITALKGKVNSISKRRN